MRTSHAAISVLLTLVGQSRANKDVISLYTNTGVYIEEASATLVLGDTPSPMTGDVALWSAIMMDQQDFLQGVTENDSPRYVACDATPPLCPKNPRLTLHL